ncbi:hypothetical protein BDV36DRAFT_261062 [Aspergillus pseudocaelatus]|uniref:Uncharacterized protein n=1 Tax=Aspergillus pseudocaelatus TaxID=1825620 RepID=A0ABQ6WGC6_9EURO|nr:hypothetical protein BDV36DRAFT_261062 [Aspergillus pseudocaelatus]
MENTVNSTMAKLTSLINYTLNGISCDTVHKPYNTSILTLVEWCCHCCCAKQEGTKKRSKLHSCRSRAK